MNRLAAVCLACLTSACTQTANFDRPPFPGASHGRLIPGEAFTHRIYEQRGTGEAIHIYIEGDGRPWITPRSPALDPTPAEPFALQLMAEDPAAAMYLGRPCYFNTGDTACANKQWWTSHRYAPEVVASMAAALEHTIDRTQPVTLIGYSGGGTLAYLLASRLSNVERLITVAANLNVALWTETHGYSSLSGSLDPAREPPLSKDIAQFHLAGMQDESVKPRVIASVAKRDPTSQLVSFPDYDHRCCWRDHWHSILEQLSE